MTTTNPYADLLPDDLTSAELFAGYGGLGEAIGRAFKSRTIWFSEFDEAPSQILKHHWPDVPNLGDVTKINWPQLALIRSMRPNILGGGFPCQDVSLAGRRAGLAEGTRSGLWFHFLKAIVALQPEFVLAENVRGILSAKAVKEADSTPATATVDSQLLELILERDEITAREADMTDTEDDYERRTELGNRIDSLMEHRTRLLGDSPDELVQRALGVVLGDLADAGYDAQWTGLRAADIGAPHGRFRVFILGTRRDLITADALRGGS
jgi:DNA (cytosine-5)-methyltransferase 1